MKAGDKVILKEDGKKYLVHDVIEINGETLVLLGLLDYPDTEQDYYTNIKDLEEIHNETNKTK